MENVESEFKKIDGDIKVLDVEIKNLKEILNLKLESYKKYGVIIMIIATLVGVGGVYSIIKEVVGGIAKTQANIQANKRINEILTPKSIQDKIEENSQEPIKVLTEKVRNEIKISINKIRDESLLSITGLINDAKSSIQEIRAENEEQLNIKLENLNKTMEAYESIINKLTQETEQTIKKLSKEVEENAQSLIDELSTYQVLLDRAQEELSKKKYDKSVVFYEKAIKKYGGQDNRMKSLCNLNLAEASIFNGEYDKALENIERVFELRKSDKDKYSTTVAIANFYKSIVQKILDKDSEVASGNFQSFLNDKENYKKSWWGFKNLEIWVNDNGIEIGHKEKEEIDRYIIDQIKAIRKKEKY